MKRIAITGGRDGLRVAPLSVASIRQATLWLRKELGIENELQPDIGRLLEHECLRKFDLTVEVRENREMPDDEAFAMPSENTIVFSEKTYDELHRLNRRARFTAGHEIGHVVLHSRVQMSRQGLQAPRKLYESSEWQANAFAGELLAPAHLIVRHCASVEDIVQTFNVSWSCAKARAKRLRKEGLITW